MFPISLVETNEPLKLHYFPQICSTNHFTLHEKNNSTIPYLGGSNLMANNSEMDFFLKHGAISSSSKSPWQPVSVATFFLIDSGSRCIAHGDKAEPLIKIARCIKSGKCTRKIRISTARETNELKLWTAQNSHNRYIRCVTRVEKIGFSRQEP